MKPYPRMSGITTLTSVIGVLTEIVRQREFDVKDFDNLKNRFLRGQSENAGSVTLTANAASTVVNHATATSDCHIAFTPLTSNAAVELAGGTMYVSSRGTQTFTITHDNNAQTDRDFTFEVIGL